MKSQIKYDQKVNILKIRLSNKKSVDSDVQNNIVVDYDKNGEIVNIEIMNINLNEFSKITPAKELISIRELIRI